MKEMDHFMITVCLLLIAFPNVMSQMNCNGDNGMFYAKFAGFGGGREKDGYCIKNSKDFNNNERRILLIGKTGVGKSTTGNTILGFDAFDSKISATSVTTQTQHNETDRFGKRLIVVDTPGFCNTKIAEGQIDMEKSRWYSFASPGIHAIILVVAVGRFTDEDQKTVDFFIKLFGEELKKYLIVVFTEKEKLENITIKQYIQTYDKSTNLRKLLDENNRYMAIGYNGDVKDRVKEVNQILYMIDDIAGEDGNNYYSNEVFQNVEEILKEEERKRREEIEEKENEKGYTEEEMVKLVTRVRAETREKIANDNSLKILEKVSKVIPAIASDFCDLIYSDYSEGWFDFLFKPFSQ